MIWSKKKWIKSQSNMDDQQTSTIGEPAQVVGLENNLEETKDG